MSDRGSPAYTTPGTPEHAEYRQLTTEILACRDLDRAGQIASRLSELRGDRSRLPEYPHARKTPAELLADITRCYRGVRLPTYNMAASALCGKCEAYHSWVYGWHYEWLCARHWVARSEAKKAGR